LTHSNAIQLLWEICQIPDFRQLWFELHVNLLERLFLQLSSPAGKLDEQFIHEQLLTIDDTRGDIETLMGRIADIRTWTYVSAHGHWLADSRALKERTAAIEDRLSDALHDKLVLKFVERTRTTSSAPPAKTRSRRTNPSGPFAGLLSHQVFNDAPNQQEQADWAETLINAQHEQFQVDPRGRINFEGMRVAQFDAGPDLLCPGVRLTTTADLGAGVRSRIQRRLLAFGRDLALGLFAPLHAPAADELTPAARGIVYQLERSLGNLLVTDASAQVEALTERDRQLLTSFGVRFGRRVIYVRRLLLPSSIATRSALVSARHSLPWDSRGFAPGQPSIPVQEQATASWWPGLGYAVIAPLAIRVDLYEILWRQLDHLATHHSFAVPRHLASLLGCEHADIQAILRTAGFTVSSGRCRPRRSGADHRRAAG
jgi:ATP-dependent RNA helicase SUPV3L1/SUV3